jgi:hypothetical protein
VNVNANVNRYLLLPLLVALLGGCASGETLLPNPAEGSAGDRVAIPVTRLTSGPPPLTVSSGITDSTRVVIRDAETWRATWDRVWSRQTPAPPLPTIDFSREMVVVVGLGTRSSGGYSIVVEGASLAGGTIDVVVQKTSPGANCFVTGALSEPVDIVRVPRRSEPVRFVERHTVRTC